MCYHCIYASYASDTAYLTTTHSIKLFSFLYPEEAVYDFNYVIFNCPSLFSSSQLLFSFLFSLGYYPSPDSNFPLNSRSSVTLFRLLLVLSMKLVCQLKFLFFSYVQFCIFLYLICLAVMKYVLHK